MFRAVFETTAEIASLTVFVTMVGLFASAFGAL